MTHRLVPALLSTSLLALCVGAAPVSPGRETPTSPAQPPPGRGVSLTSDLAVKPWTGDFDGMVMRRRIRILTPYSKTHYFIDKGVPRGIVYDAGMKVEEAVNAALKTTPATKIHVVFVPTSRDALYQSLVEGRGDVIAANVAITPERQKLVDFTIPTRTNVAQIVVTGPGAPPLASLAQLAGQQVAVRDKSFQFERLTALNVRFKGEGKAPVTIRPLPGSLEDEDILEMVSAGLVKATVVDQAMGEFWKQILPALTVHPNIAVDDRGATAWGVRKGSPKLIAVLDPIVKANNAGTAFGNEMLRRYLRSTKIVKSATSEVELRKFRALVDVFQKYGKQYDVDYVLMLAQGYQESQLDQNAKSHVGAIGVMQVMPATGKELKVGNINEIEANVHAGVKYVRFMIDQYFAKEPIDHVNRTLFAFAAYNCGPGRLRQLRKEAASRGLDANVWFNNVERIAGERVGRETVQYVSNIYKYYVAYMLTIEDWAAAGGRKAPGGQPAAR
jgi:membrane-bound lytic murein transglycosylase MltF